MMTETLRAISRSLADDVRNLATISHNVANLHTPGYRGMRTAADFAAAMESRTSLDQRDGALMQTSRQLDLALRGSGFFAIDRDGRSLLVRAGAFRINGENLLTTANGDIVLGLAGPIALSSVEIRVDNDGLIMREGRPAGQLRIVAVADASRLHAVGGGAYAYDGEIVEWKGKVIQGALESANVDPAEETVRLMETTRHAESVQRAISIYDKAMDVGINQIGGN
jgi:flagellar basal-body rod protein FlgF